MLRMGNVLKATDIRTVDGTDKNFLVLKKDVTFQENNVAGPTPLSLFRSLWNIFPCNLPCHSDGSRLGSQ